VLQFGSLVERKIARFAGYGGASGTWFSHAGVKSPGPTWSVAAISLVLRRLSRADRCDQRLGQQHVSREGRMHLLLEAFAGGKLAVHMSRNQIHL